MSGGKEFLFWLVVFATIAVACAINEYIQRRRNRRLPDPHHTARRRDTNDEWQVGTGRARTLATEDMQ